MFAFDPKGPASGGKFRIHLPEVLKFDELTLKNIILAIVIMKPQTAFRCRSENRKNCIL